MINRKYLPSLAVVVYLVLSVLMAVFFLPADGEGGALIVRLLLSMILISGFLLLVLVVYSVVEELLE